MPYISYFLLRVCVGGALELCGALFLLMNGKGKNKEKEELDHSTLYLLSVHR